MNTKNTLYIAEPLFSEQLQRHSPEASFPPIKKIGITTDHPERRERELLGTVSPVKISIVKAWTGIDARAVEGMLHTILDNSRLDGEYFWDGKETLVDAVSEFMAEYHSDAKEISIEDDADVKAASDAADENRSQRIQTDVVPALNALGIPYRVTKNGALLDLGDYSLELWGLKDNHRYSLFISSEHKSVADALVDFEGSVGPTASASEDGRRRSRISKARLNDIIESIRKYIDKQAGDT